jgi:hypothetical protein
MRFLYSEIIIPTNERPSRASLGAQSLVEALRPTNSPRQKQTEEIRARCEVASMSPSERRLAGCSGYDRGTSDI